MRLDDGPADRQSHAHAAFLGGEERLEDPFRKLYTRAAIADLDPDDTTRAIDAQAQHTVAWGLAHRVDAIAHEIEENLLDLDAVQGDGWQAGLNLGIEPNAAPRCLDGQQVADFGDEA